MRQIAIGKQVRVSDSIWYNVFHPLQNDDTGKPVTQGRVLLSFELLSQAESEKKPNALGRSQPNAFPTLPKPVGRFSFDIMHPFRFIKDIIGPDLCGVCLKVIVLLTLLLLLLIIFWYLLTSVLGTKLANSLTGK